MKEKVHLILENGNDYFSGVEIVENLRRAGYYIVPFKPTRVMLRAAGSEPVDRETIWRAMVDASQ
jgi:hypothetical protein